MYHTRRIIRGLVRLIREGPKFCVLNCMELGQLLKSFVDVPGSLEIRYSEIKGIAEYCDQNSTKKGCKPFLSETCRNRSC